MGYKAFEPHRGRQPSPTSLLRGSLSISWCWDTVHFSDPPAYNDSPRHSLFKVSDAYSALYFYGHFCVFLRKPNTMLPPRACEYNPSCTTRPHMNVYDCLFPDIFIGLNAIRAFSIISLLLVFASSIFVLVNDIQAVNRAAASSTDMTDCDYIECAPISSLSIRLVRR